MTEEKGKETYDIVSGILEETRHEADGLIEKAKKDARQRITSAEKSAENILHRQDEETEKRIVEITKDTEGRIATETRRMVLKEQERLFGAVHDEARRRMEKNIGEPGYRDTLKGWIVEAAMGLECTKAVVHTSAEEAGFMDSHLLREASDRIFNLTGRKVELSFDANKPTATQGILLTEEGGGRAFNNQVSTRLVRYKSAVRTAIYKELFTES